MLTIVGNGTSRKDIDLKSLDRWYGCNRIYTDATPELLFVIDSPMQSQVMQDEYHHNNKVVFPGWEPLEIGFLHMMRSGFDYSGEKQRVYVNKGDDYFIAQGNEEHVDFVGYSSVHKQNIVMYKNPLLKNLFCGMTALGYALAENEPEIALLGFDALWSENVDNIYQGQPLYRHKYTLEDRVYTAQRSQLIALLEQFGNSKVYFQKSVDDFEEVDYTNLSYYANSDRWILGIGIPESENTM